MSVPLIIKDVEGSTNSYARKPIAWACRTCNKVDWADSKEQLAEPEHISYMGTDIGSCKGKMIPLYDK